MPTALNLEFAEVQVEPALAAQLACECGPDPASISAAIRNAFESLMGFVRRHQLTENGNPRCIYTAYGATGVAFTVALPVAAGPGSVVEDSSVRVELLPAVKAYRFIHRGPYPDLAQTYHHISGFMKEKGWMKSEADWMRYMPMWEEYLNDPETTPPAELRTYIYLPVSD